MKMLHKVWKKLIWVWNKCQGYEKSAWWYETNDKCSETNTHLKDAHIVLLTDFFRTVYVWCGIVLYLSGRYLCGVGLFRTIVNGSTHCVLFSSLFIYHLNHTVPFLQPTTGRKLYCVPLVAHHKWICFVLLKLFLYQNQTHRTTNEILFRILRILWKIGRVDSRFENDRHASGARGAYARGVSLPLQGRAPACKR